MISTLTQQQNDISNDTYHEKLNTKTRTALKMEVNFDHEIIWKYEAKKVYGAEFDSLDPNTPPENALSPASCCDKATRQTPSSRPIYTMISAKAKTIIPRRAARHYVY
jgi:hypothetical protein